MFLFYLFSSDRLSFIKFDSHWICSTFRFYSIKITLHLHFRSLFVSLRDSCVQVCLCMWCLNLQFSIGSCFMYWCQWIQVTLKATNDHQLTDVYKMVCFDSLLFLLWVLLFFICITQKYFEALKQQCQKLIIASIETWNEIHKIEQKSISPDVLCIPFIYTFPLSVLI